MEGLPLIRPGFDAKLSHPSYVWLHDLHTPYRLRVVGAVQQLFPDGEPVLFQVATELPTVIPSIPALPLLAFTRRNASIRFSFRPHLAVIALASSLTLHLHQVG
jgi:hypothetical protein